MFTGIIESIGIVQASFTEGTNKTFLIQSPISNQLKIDQSLAHSGVCLTVTTVSSDSHQVTAVSETLSKTNLNQWQVGTCINLERCMKADGRFDGHIVQGHVDDTARCTAIQNMSGSWKFDFTLNHVEQSTLLVEKGSVCINGVSLTCYDVGESNFSVAIIPYTMEHTTFKNLKEGDTVNLEFDIIGKYVRRMMIK